MRPRLLLAATACALLLAGCSATPTAVEQPPGRDPSQPLSAYLREVTPESKGIRFADALIEQHRVAGEDGVELDVWTALPPGKGPFPTVLRITPYYAGGQPASMGRLGDELLARGYALALANVRGTGMSGGCFEQGSEREARDNAAIVEHLAAQPWSNGNVGIIGVSYDGTTPQETWIEAPPALKTIVPIAAISDFYKYNFVNGVPIVIQGFGFNTYYWLMEDALWNTGAPGQRDPEALAGTIAGAACPEQVAVQEGGVSSTVDGNKDAYWQSRDLVARLQQRMDEGEAPTASVLYIHGLQDWNVKPHHMEDWLDAIAATGVPYKAMLGQWGHAWPQSTSVDATCEGDADGGDPCRADWWEQVLVAWFDQFLKEVPTGILEAPAVQVQDDDGVWRHEDTWPPSDVAWTAFLPGPGNRLVASEEERAGGALDYTWVDLPGSVELPAGPARSVLFRSEPVAADFHVSGQPVFVGNFTAQGPRASVLFSLAEELPDGTLRPFNYAAQSLNHVASLEQGDPDVSGETQAVKVRFFPQDDVVHAGNRLVLHIAGSLLPGGPGPALQPVHGGAAIAFDAQGSRLLLPVDGTIVPESPQPYDA